MWSSSLRDCVLGLIILLFVLSIIVLPIFSDNVIVMLIFCMPIGTLFLTSIWIATLGGVFVYGIRRNKVGYCVAPVLFFALWFAASIINRGVVSYIHRDTSNLGPLLAEASKETTLIISKSEVMRPKILADGPIQRIIIVDPSPASDQPKSIEEETIQRGPKCGGPLFSSDPFVKAARTNECIRRESIEAIPDGLELMVQNDTRIKGRLGECCSSVTLSVRRNGKTQILTTWSTGSMMVLPYVPMFFSVNSFGPPGSIWAVGGSPFLLQPIQYGHYPATAEGAVTTIFGIDPNAPLDAVALSPAEWERSVAAAGRVPSPSACDAVWSLASAAKRAGVVTDNIMQSVADCMGFDWVDFSSFGLDIYFLKASPEQKNRLAEKLLKRLTSPEICPACYASVTDFLPSRTEDEHFRVEARAAFASHKDLAVWQYEGLLRLSGASNIGDKALRDEAFAVTLSDQNAFSRRVRAFARVYREFSDSEFDAIINPIALVPLPEREEIRKVVRLQSRDKIISNPPQ